MNKLVEIYIETAIKLEEFGQVCQCDTGAEDTASLISELSNNLDYYKEKYNFKEIKKSRFDDFRCGVKEGVLTY